MNQQARTFSDIVGHDAPIALLERTLASGRITPAYLFTGPERVGKTTVASLFAAGVNCERPQGRPCGECLSCGKVRDRNHPDVRFVEPDGATFKIDQVRRIRRQIALRPLEARYKVYVLTQVEKMRAEAANALLKTLEEPPGAAVLILVTTSASALLPTIRSRCQIVNFLRVPAEQLAASLMARGLSQELATQLAAISDGRIGEAIERAESEDIPAVELPETLRGATHLDAFRIAEGWSRDPQTLDELITWYRDLMLLIANAPDEQVVHQEHLPTLRLLARRETFPSLRNKIRIIMEARRRLRRNINAALTMEVLAFKLLQTPLAHVKRMSPLV